MATIMATDDRQESQPRATLNKLAKMYRVGFRREHLAYLRDFIDTPAFAEQVANTCLLTFKDTSLADVDNNINAIFPIVWGRPMECMLHMDLVHELGFDETSRTRTTKVDPYVTSFPISLGGSEAHRQGAMWCTYAFGPNLESREPGTHSAELRGSSGEVNFEQYEQMYAKTVELIVVSADHACTVTGCSRAVVRLPIIGRGAFAATMSVSDMVHIDAAILASLHATDKLIHEEFSHVTIDICSYDALPMFDDFHSEWGHLQVSTGPVEGNIATLPAEEEGTVCVIVPAGDNGSLFGNALSEDRTVEGTALAGVRNTWFPTAYLSNTQFMPVLNPAAPDAPAWSSPSQASKLVYKVTELPGKRVSMHMMKKCAELC